MDREKINQYLKAAERDLASVRNSLVIVAQTGDGSDLSTPRRILARLHSEASVLGLVEAANLLSAALTRVEQISLSSDFHPPDVYAVLDTIAQIEALLWKTPFQSDDFLSDIDSFVESIFNDLGPASETPSQNGNTARGFEEKFEIDDETLEIFRSEAEELLSNIKNDLKDLAKSPGDHHALWNIRRHAHTFKGAAGIVGLREASEVAHRMEDLLDKMVELSFDPVPQVFEFLQASARHLTAIVGSVDIDETLDDLKVQYDQAMSCLSSSGVLAAVPDSNSGNRGLPIATGETPKAATSPIVRVSLARLDELIKLSRRLAATRSTFAAEVSNVKCNRSVYPEGFSRLDALFDAQKKLIDELQAKLLRIRMVKFGTLATRLSRAVHVTSVDENKKADVIIVNGDIEIDTQVIDALIEPLLHLLKNAVVHGIEPPDTRRLLGKPERGIIRIGLESDKKVLILEVADDGAGISAKKLKEKAIAAGILTAETAANMPDDAAAELIFDRGLTTADKIDLNAGRGVGMSIVRESVENRGGTVTVESHAQLGTKIRVRLPHVRDVTDLPLANPLECQTAVEQPQLPLIMIVDDSSTVRRHSAQLAQFAGLKVISANNGAEAVELLLSNDWHPDLILSDVEMPQIDGWEFLKFIKEDEVFCSIPIVMVTSLNAAENRARAIDLGAFDYLNKPLTEQSLEQVLEKLKIGVIS